MKVINNSQTKLDVAKLEKAGYVCKEVELDGRPVLSVNVSGLEVLVGYNVHYEKGNLAIYDGLSDESVRVNEIEIDEYNEVGKRITKFLENPKNENATLFNNPYLGHCIKTDDAEDFKVCYVNNGVLQVAKEQPSLDIVALAISLTGSDETPNLQELIGDYKEPEIEVLTAGFLEAASNDGIDLEIDFDLTSGWYVEASYRGVSADVKFDLIVDRKDNQFELRLVNGPQMEGVLLLLIKETDDLMDGKLNISSFRKNFEESEFVGMLEKTVTSYTTSLIEVTVSMPDICPAHVLNPIHFKPSEYDYHVVNVPKRIEDKYQGYITADTKGNVTWNTLDPAKDIIGHYMLDNLIDDTIKLVIYNRKIASGEYGVMYTLKMECEKYVLVDSMFLHDDIVSTDEDTVTITVGNVIETYESAADGRFMITGKSLKR